MSIQIIEQLKLLTVKKEQDFSLVANYFMDNVAENPILMQQSHPFTQDQAFYHALLTPVTDYYGIEITVVHFMLLQLKEAHFVHGFAYLSNSFFITLYYFQDIQMGMAIYAPATGNCEFFRLTVTTLPKSSEKTIIFPTTLNRTIN